MNVDHKGLWGILPHYKRGNGAWTRWKAGASGETNWRHRGSTVASLNPWEKLIIKSCKKRVMVNPPIVWLAQAQSSSCFQWITRLQLWTSFHMRHKCLGPLNLSLAVTDGKVCPLSGFKKEVELLHRAKWAECVIPSPAECLSLGSCQGWLPPKCNAWTHPNLLCPLLWGPKPGPSPHLQWNKDGAYYL